MESQVEFYIKWGFYTDHNVHNGILEMMRFSIIVLNNLGALYLHIG